MSSWLAVLGLSASLAACTGAPVQPAPPPAQALSSSSSPAASSSVQPVLPRRAVEPPISAASVMAIVRALPPDRALARPGHGPAREWIVEHLAGLGLSPAVQPFTWAGAPDQQLANIEWTLPGSDADAPLLVVCAHYDTVPYSGGADDNGSGVAALLELARRLADRSLSAEVRLLWFDAEEVGLVGSRAWLEQLDSGERERLLGAINLETVGYADRRPASQQMPPGSSVLLDPGDVGDFVLVVGNQSSAELAAIVALGLSAEAGPALRTEVFDRLPGVGWVMPDSRRSDHASFWDIGLSAVMLTDTANFRNPNYHRASDLPGTLDGEFLAAVTRGVERALLILAEDW